MFVTTKGKQNKKKTEHVMKKYLKSAIFYQEKFALIFLIRANKIPLNEIISKLCQKKKVDSGWIGYKVLISTLQIKVHND